VGWHRTREEVDYGDPVPLGVAHAEADTDRHDEGGVGGVDGDEHEGPYLVTMVFGVDHRKPAQRPRPAVRRHGPFKAAGSVMDHLQTLVLQSGPSQVRIWGLNILGSLATSSQTRGS
jgi:hypothetical protein